MELIPLIDKPSVDHDTSKIFMEIVDANGVTLNVGTINSSQFGSYSCIVEMLKNPTNSVVSIKQYSGLTINYSHPKLNVQPETTKQLN